jgi:hypothetical protein
MDISNRYLSNDHFNHLLLSRDILHLPILSVPAGSMYYDVTNVEQMSIYGWSCCEGTGSIFYGCNLCLLVAVGPKSSGLIV